MKKLTISALALLAGLPAMAQDTMILGEVTIFSSLTPQDVNRTGATVEVITEEELRETAVQSVSDYIARLPGVTVAQNGGFGKQTAVRVRGLAGAYVAVRVDGIDVSDPSATQSLFDFGGLMTSDIARIEILKGGQSALYGSEAIAGVINITTTAAVEEGRAISLAAEVGSFGTVAGSIAFSEAYERGSLAFTYSQTSTDGFSARDSDTEEDGGRARRLSFSGEYEATDSVTLGFTGFVGDSETEFDNSTTDPTGEQFVETTGLRVFAEVTGDRVDSTFSASTFANDRFFPGGFTENFRGERKELSYVGTTQFGATDVSFGAEYSRESYTSDFEAGDATVASIFGEVLYAPNEALDLSFSLRGDKHSEFEGSLNARAALAWRASPNTIVRAVASTGTRNPSLYELFGFFGNPDLTPETSRTLEAGVERIFDGGGFVKATAFRTDIEDLITYDFPTNAYAQVGGATETSGIELSGAMPINDYVDVFGNYTYTRAQTDGVDLVRVPTHELALGVSAMLKEGLTGELSLRHVADFTDFDAVTFARKDMANFTVVNAALTYEVADGQEAYVRVENLFDEDYQTVDGFNQPGRSIYVGFRATF